MLEILRVSEKGLQVLEKVESDCWINVVSPTEDDLKKLKQIIDIPNELLVSLQDIEEVPVIESYENFNFILIKTPYNNIQNELEYYSVPIGIFMTNYFVITVCYHDNDVLHKLKSQRFSFRKTQLAFRLLLVSARLYLNYLTEIKKKMYEIEKQLEKSQKNKVIMQLLEIEESLVYFSTSLKSNEILLERILQEGTLIKRPEDKKLIASAIDENKQAIEMTYTYSNILSNTLDAFASIISNNLNLVMKVLASVTVVLSLPILVASIYGMNIKLPFQTSPHAFIIVMVISFLLSILAVLFLWRNNYF